MEATMKISKLAFESFKRSEMTDLEMWEGRYTGNTTGYILEFIGKCMQNPDKTFQVGHMSYYEQRRRVFNEVRHMVSELGLLHFEFSTVKLSVTYKPFMEVKKVVTWVEV